jgi:hypothetical protein
MMKRKKQIRFNPILILFPEATDVIAGMVLSESHFLSQGRFVVAQKDFDVEVFPRGFRSASKSLCATGE